MSETLPGFPIPRDWDKEFKEAGINVQAERRLVQAWLKVVGRHKYTKSVNDNVSFLGWCRTTTHREFYALLWEIPDWPKSPGYNMVQDAIRKARKVHAENV
jgi:hypothetical protein